MRILYQRLIYAGVIVLLIMYASAIALLLLSSGCAFRPMYNNGVRSGYNLHVYEPFDNSRDWGTQLSRRTSKSPFWIRRSRGQLAIYSN
jgi:hypothetical protein